MLFFDDGKKLEKAFNQDQFDALVGILEQREDKAATKQDVKELQEDTKNLELRLVAESEKNRESLQASLRESELRTQVEIEKIRAETEKVRSELKTDIEKVRAELKTDIEKVRLETEKIRAELTERLESNKHEILKWITGMVVAQAAVFIALAGVAVGLVAFYR